MLNFFQHHWSRREKYLMRIGALRAALALVLGVLLAALLIVWQVGKNDIRSNTLRTEAHEMQPGQTIPPNAGPIGGPFKLVNQDGHTISDADFRGKYLLIYFGYTY